MYSIGIPTITEKVSIGNDFIGFTILDISTRDSAQNEIKQREIRLTLTPVSFEISHHHGNCIQFGLRVLRYAIKTEISYGKLSKV